MGNKHLVTIVASQTILRCVAKSRIKKKVLSMNCTSEDEEYEYLAEIEVKEQVNGASSRHPNKAFATLLVNGNQEKFQLNTGSTVNIMTDATVLTLCDHNGWSELEETPVILVMYNQSEVKPLGKKRFKVVNPKNSKKYSTAAKRWRCGAGPTVTRLFKMLLKRK